MAVCRTIKVSTWLSKTPDPNRIVHLQDIPGQVLSRKVPQRTPRVHYWTGFSTKELDKVLKLPLAQSQS